MLLKKLPAKVVKIFEEAGSWKNEVGRRSFQVKATHKCFNE